MGITAKVSRVLAAANVPCNVIAAYHHDYLVPLALGEKAFSYSNQPISNLKILLNFKMLALGKLRQRENSLPLIIGVRRRYDQI